jgi:hypothetical protein
MISFADLSLADHHRSAQGRVHFINAELSAAISYTTGFGAEHVTWNDHRQTSPGGERPPALMGLVH